MSFQDDYRRHVERLKRDVNLIDLAEWLGMKAAVRSGQNQAVYHAPWRSDKKPSLSVFFHEGVWLWKDHTENRSGSSIDLLMRVRGLEFTEAVREMSERFNLPIPRADAPAEQREEALHEMIARRCLENPELVTNYLKGRGISEAVIQRATKAGTLGYNAWINPKKADGEVGRGGPAAAFILRTLNPGHVAAVEMRYLDPSLNGGVKNQCQGDKRGHFWCANPRALLTDKVKTVYVTEGPINALSIESAGLPYTAAIATCGVANIEQVDWRILKGKRVLICMDHTDKIDENENSRLRGYRPGLHAAWRLHELMTAVDVAALFVNQDSWGDGTDVNDLLQKKPGELKTLLMDVEDWLIQGLPAKVGVAGKPRIYLPWHHFRMYQKFRVREDTTEWITKYNTVKEGDEERQVPEFSEVASFRVAGLSRITVQSETATMTGDKDASPRTLFAVSVQAPRHGHRLIRKVFEDRHLHKVDRWEEFGSVFNPGALKRMLGVLEVATDIGARHAVNFVGLAWKDGRLVVNEGSDCYFSDPDNQCPYANLAFPSGTVSDGRAVLRAYQAMFRGNAGLQTLVWCLGGHMKAFLGFWPHCTLQGNKGSGKSTLVKALERAIGMQMRSGQSMQTEFRIVTSVSYTSHPIGWEEISARAQQIIDRAVHILQESYQHTFTTRGQYQTPYLLSAPVLLAGEDVPVRSLIGKIVRVELTGKKGDLLPDEMPKFPVRQWLEFLASQEKQGVRSTFKRIRQDCLDSSRASGNDDGANRMAENYAAVLTAWAYLCEFLNIQVDQGDFVRDLKTEMNRHIGETSGDREPWVWIMEMVLSEIAMRDFRFPYLFETLERDQSTERRCLLIRTSHIMDHIARVPALRDRWNMLPIKSDRVFKKQLLQAGALVMKNDVEAMEFERTLGENHIEGSAGRRVAHLVAIDLAKLEEFGIFAVGDAQVVPSMHPPILGPASAGAAR